MQHQQHVLGSVSDVDHMVHEKSHCEYWEEPYTLPGRVF
jgi:hypothetical protein